MGSTGFLLGTVNCCDPVVIATTIASVLIRHHNLLNGV